MLGEIPGSNGECPCQEGWLRKQTTLREICTEVRDITTVRGETILFLCGLVTITQQLLHPSLRPSLLPPLPPPSLLSRYKLVCDQTWPVFTCSPRDAATAICQQHRVLDDIAYGHTKLFIRTPRTLTLLEQERAKRIPMVVVTMQRVRRGGWGGGGGGGGGGDGQ